MRVSILKQKNVLWKYFTCFLILWIQNLKILLTRNIVSFGKPMLIGYQVIRYASHTNFLKFIRNSHILKYVICS